MLWALTLVAVAVPLVASMHVTISSGASECFYVKAESYKHGISLNYEVLRGVADELETELRDGKEDVVYTHKGAQGRYASPIRGGGMHSVCFNNDRLPAGDVVVGFSFHADDPNHEVLSNADATKIKQVVELEDMVYELSVNLDMVKDSQTFMETLANYQDQLITSTHDQIMWWTFVEMAVLMAVSVAQISYLRRTLEPDDWTISITFVFEQLLPPLRYRDYQPKAMESWTNYFTTHFYAMKARPVSAFDPSGFIIIISFLLLLVGVVAATTRALVSNRGLVLRSRVEKNLQDMSDYVLDQRMRVGENLQYIKVRAIDHSGRQGFIAEMLSYAYLSRLAFSLSIFAIASYLNTLAAVIAGWRTPNVVILDLAKGNTNVKTLPDLGHDLFRYVMTKIYGHTTYMEWFDLPDEFLAAVGMLTSLIIILHPRRLLILRRFCFIFAIINLMRACCVAVTSLPDASPMCISQFDSVERGTYKSHPIFPKAFFRAWKVLIRPSQHITCGDMIFSGHAVFLVLCCMFARTYCERSELNTPFTRRYPYILWMIRYYNYILSAGGLFAIVGTRLHYTLDVLIAIYITIQVWVTYHWLMNHPESGFALINWLEHAEVHLVDKNAYRKAGGLSDRIEKSD